MQFCQTAVMGSPIAAESLEEQAQRAKRWVERDIRVRFHLKYERLWKCRDCGGRHEPHREWCPCGGLLEPAPYSWPGGGGPIAVEGGGWILLSKIPRLDVAV